MTIDPYFKSFNEATVPPSEHAKRCGNIVDARTSDQEMVLVCYDHNICWYTGVMFWNNGVPPSDTKMFKAAEEKYGRASAAA